MGKTTDIRSMRAAAFIRFCSSSDFQLAAVRSEGSFVSKVPNPDPQQLTLPDHNGYNKTMKFAYLIEPPFNHRMPDGTVTGTDVELAKFVIDELNLGEFEPIETEFAELLQGVASGKWRMTTGLFATDERKQTASFSIPIWALPDGLLVSIGNPKNLSGYQSIAAQKDCTLAVIRDQFQHRSAVEFGVPENRLHIFETYSEAANAVLTGKIDAYVSVGRAHTGYIDLNNEQQLEVVTVPASEKQPAFGSFAFSKQDHVLIDGVNGVLRSYYGSPSHREMMYSFGFSDAEIDLVVDSYE